MKIFCLVFLCLFSKILLANEIVGQMSIFKDISTGDSYLKISMDGWSSYITYGDNNKMLKVTNDIKKTL
ncbi:hypothetical protein C5F62_14575 [Photobacterium damselae subsp. damselae]|nr:hypothetical protein C5F62_14575 [Photobacterium damselae subsp. damselae]